MKNVVFVGDTISKTNVHSEVAFVGAKCFTTLVKWIKVINPDYYICINSDTWQDIGIIREMACNTDFKFIALGKRASNRLSKYSIPHLEMLHPSGLNRKINDKEHVKICLEQCKEFINEPA